MHIYAEDVLHLTLHDILLVVNPVGGFLALGQGTHILFYQGLQGLGVHVTDNDEGGAGSVGKELAIVLLEGGQAGLCEFFLGQHLATRVIGVEGLVELFLEFVVGLVHQVGQDGLDLVNAVLPLFGVEAGIHKFQIQELEGGLQVLYGAAAGNAVLQRVDEGVHAQVFTGEHLAHDGAGEGRYAGVALEQAHNRVVEAGEVLGGNEAFTALLGEGEQNLVFLEVRRIDHHLYAILERPLGGTVNGGSGVFHLGTLEFGRVQEGLGNLFSFRCGNVGGFNLCHHFEQLLCGRGGDAFFLGTVVDDYQVLRTANLSGHLVHGSSVDLAKEGLYNLLFHIRLHDGLFVKEVAQDGTDEFRILTRRSAVHACFVHVEDVGLGTGELGVGDAIFLEADNLRVEILEAAQDVFFAEGDVAHNGVDVFVNQAAQIDAAGQIRGSGLGGDVVEALTHDHGEKALQKVGDNANRGSVGYFRKGLAVPDEFDGRRGGFRVRDNAHTRFCVVGDGLDGLFERVLLGGNNAEEVFDDLLGAVYIDIAHHNYGLVAGMVPSLVEVGEALILEGLQVFLQADEGALGQRGLRAEVVGEAALHAAPAGVAALTALLDDNAALCVNLLGLVEHIVGVVAQDHQAAVHNALALYRDVVEHVLRLLKAGGSIDVAAELCADAAKIIQDPLAGEVLGSVEAHVLQEMGQAVLLRLNLLDGTHIGGQVEFGTSLGELIVADVVGESVVQMADAHLVGVGKLRHLGEVRFHLLAGGLLGQGHDGGKGQRTQGKKDSLHIFKVYKVFSK